MLLELGVENFAVIERLRLTFARGFSVLSGETGAGKSLLIDAVNALLGGRCGAEFVREGASEARVEGIWSLPEMAGTDDADPPLVAILDEHGVGADEGTIILSREIHRSGRTVARVGGRAVPVGVLQQIGRALVDVHGQGEHLSLLHVGQHVAFLDRYAGMTDSRRSFAAAFVELRQLQRTTGEMVRGEREQAQRADLLRFQVKEICEARLRVGEEEELDAEHRLLSNAGQLVDAADATYRLLHGGFGDERGVIDSLREVERQVGQLVKLDTSIGGHLRAIEEAAYQLEDVAAAMRHYRDGVEFNPARQKTIEERLNQITHLKRKYGNSIADVLRFADAAEAELNEIGGGGERLIELRRRQSELVGYLTELGEQLATARRHNAEQLALAVERELADLNMAGTRFSVSCERAEDPDGLPFRDGRRYAYDRTGIDHVEFLVATNPGEPLRPLRKVASGGETARLMLALKTVLTRADAVPTLIFDEIDVGIGGRSGKVVGEKLWGLSADHQVLCVTHLPQIACYGDAHFQISKSVVGERAVTTVRPVGDGERILELAAMLGGVAESQSAQQNARELLAGAAHWKKAAVARQNVSVG